METQNGSPMDDVTRKEKKMDRVTLHHPGLPDDDTQLRPTHIRLVFEEMTKGTAFGSELNFSVRAGTLADACELVRSRYRCRDVRKELNRAIRLARRIEDEKPNSPYVRLSCIDRGLMGELLEAQSTAAAA